jgi:hypothetical protein
VVCLWSFKRIDQLHLECRISETTRGQHVTVRPLGSPRLFRYLLYDRLMFWHIDERQYNVDELVIATDMMAEKAQERGVSLLDTDALREAKKHV